MPRRNPTLTPEQAARWDSLRRKGIAIPPQPELLQRIQQFANNPAFRGRDLAALIRQDAALTAQLLDIVNAPAYGLGRELESVEEAVMLLGMEQTHSLCRAALLRETLGRQDRALEIYWERSAAVAELTTAVAHRQKTGLSLDLAYLAGLFHACGVPLLMRALPEYGRALEREEDWLHLDGLDRQFDADHVLISYLVSRAWHLPEVAAEAVMQQHTIHTCRPDCALSSKCQKQAKQAQCTLLTASLQLATHLYNRMFLARDNATWNSLRPQVLSDLGMTEEELTQLA